MGIGLEDILEGAGDHVVHFDDRDCDPAPNRTGPAGAAAVTVLEDVIASDEAARMEVVRRYDIFATAPDGVFDHITALAARLFAVPIALVSVVDTDRIWFKSHHGLPGITQIDREPGLCDSVITDRQPRIVTDAAQDPRTMTNSLVSGPFGLRFYAGVPLTTHEGYNIGTLCVIDHKPRLVTADDLANLQDLATLVIDELERRVAGHRIVAREERLRREAEELADALQASLLPPRTPDLPGMQIATRYIAGEQGLKVGGDFFDVFRLASNDWGIVLGDACGKGAQPAALAALTRWTIRASSVHQFRPSEILGEVNTALRADANADGDGHFCTAVFSRLQLDTCGAWLTLASAGHPLPAVVRRRGQVELRGHSTTPLGMFDTIEPVDERVGLGPGDALVLYTDGITEARDDAGATFGEENLVATLRGLTGRPADEVADGVIAAARCFAGSRFEDDVAVVVVRVPDNAGSEPLARISAATGLPVAELKLPNYSH